MTAHVVDEEVRAAGHRAQLLAGTSIEDRRIEAAGIRTAVLAAGQGQPVLLLHGPGEFAAGFASLISGLAATHRVVAPDLPGHGDSAISADLAAERVLDWLAEVIDATCDSTPAIVGRVGGGAIAARLAAERADLVGQLVLVDTLGLAPFQPAPPFGEAVERFFASPSNATYERLMQYCLFDVDAFRSRLGAQWEAFSGYAVDRAKASSIEAGGALMAEFGINPIGESVLDSITVPTALIWGRHDMATPLRVAEATSRRYGWPLHVIDDAGDDPALDQPDQFLDVLRGVLTR